jgi:peptidyl-prolyl cis-trans isomerase SurA
MKIRPFLLLFCSLMCAVPVLAGGPDNKSTDPKNDTIVEEIVARVNNHIVTRSEYLRAEQEVKNEAQQASPPPSPQDVAEREKDVLRDLISQQLLLQKGQDMGINADTDLVKRLDEIRKQMKLESMDDLEKAAQAQGVSFEEFKENLRTNIITQQVIQREVGGNIKISHEDTAKYYEQHKSELARPEQVRLSEILVSTAGKPVAKTDTGSTGDTEAAAQATEQQRIVAAQAKANSLLDEIKKGAKFADVARKNSDGPTAAQGGDLGYFKRGTLAKELEDKTFAMKPGDVSDVIQTKQGFVILMATEHQKAGVPPLKDVEPKLQDALYYEKLQPALKQYVTKLREDAFIYVKPGYVDTGASPNETAPVFTTASVEKGAKPLKKKKKFLVF